MGVLLSIILSYAGGLEALDFIRHILLGMIPEGDPNFEVLVQHYTQQLEISLNNASKLKNEYYDGYLILTEDKDGKLISASIKYHGNSKPDTTALLFSTKISSFGQDSVDSYENIEKHSGIKNTPERYISKSQSIPTDMEIKPNVTSRNKSPSPSIGNISDPSLAHSFDDRSPNEANDSKDKLTWHYRPLSPIPQATLPEIHFQSFDETLDFKHDPDTPFNEDFLRSLDGVKFRPLTRNDPSGRRRSYKKRHSSSSTSSRESRASREEELKVFTSLEEAELENVNSNDPGFGSAPNLTSRSYSRSRSKENTNDTKPKENERRSLENSVENPDAEESFDFKPRLRDLPKLDSFEEEKHCDDTRTNDEVIVNDNDDFWGKSDD